MGRICGFPQATCVQIPAVQCRPRSRGQAAPPTETPLPSPHRGLCSLRCCEPSFLYPPPFLPLLKESQQAAQMFELLLAPTRHGQGLLFRLSAPLSWH